VTGARAVPGVHAVLTHADLRPLLTGERIPLAVAAAAIRFHVDPFPLAHSELCYVGEPVALVVAETAPQAMDAAERVDAVYEPLAAVTRSEDALSALAPQIWPQHGSNLCVDSETGDQIATEAVFASAAHVVRLQTAINRVTGVPMELRAAVGVYDKAAAQYTVYTSAGGGVIRQRDDIAGALGIPKEAVRVISGDVGGNFGIRNNTCPEFVLVAWAAQRIGRPVKWVCERREAFLTDFHGRDLRSEAELALDADGNFLALRATNTSNLGASAISFVPLAKGIAVSSSVYHIPTSYMRGVGVITNTPDLGLSECRAAGGRVRARTADRHRLPPAWLRSARIAPAQPGAARGDALSQSVGSGLRQRRLPGVTAPCR
jgi:carbon-monoxide dehydrogenase large subunit